MIRRTPERWLCFLVLIGFAVTGAAGSPQEALQQGKDLGAQLNRTFDPAHVDPATAVPGYAGHQRTCEPVA